MVVLAGLELWLWVSINVGVGIEGKQYVLYGVVVVDIGGRVIKLFTSLPNFAYFALKSINKHTYVNAKVFSTEIIAN